MGYLSRTAELTVEQATQLLSTVDGVAVRAVEQIGFTNDVFQVITERCKASTFSS